MATTAQGILEAAIPAALAKAGLTLSHKGKVRDTYILPNHDDLLLVMATDRVSIFDFVIPATIAGKGEILTAMTIFWLTEVLPGSLAHHLVAFGNEIDLFLPPTLRQSGVLRKRCIVVKKFDMLSVECIVRHYLTGSGWASYKEHGHVCGIRLPDGLHDGSQLPEPIFTPTTKALEGHDEHLPTADVIAEHGTWLTTKSLVAFQAISQFAESRGVLLADSKFEFAKVGTLADEVGTPDSSRFWDSAEWAIANESGTSPPSYDKQHLRNWGKGFGIPKLDPCNSDDQDYVRKLFVPPLVLQETSDKYHAIFQRLVGMALAEFQQMWMDIHA
ncbi:MAG: hypothetical protein A3C02_01815 [Candidatus Andersenbacteria bacterium RIFCSPHIGHO2_02_FULL_45_11]|uniref:Phosphoribosylaminoimidazole-succinocarboxamide synthase n=1 Tax=Candidatus Andersenbacteria bacterium RIFCSPHIGHO2_12_FULL_45_11 TaxID=1797281 RepID=A0A1G1X041_9BACT|nr:MAG: hypothetical protein A2805_01330 [Candidatus Andersenbacteria bacterium RIFCSPHIGHO2_01_FULL_46_36]OGY32922.1 MAG: hypothetical protein A3C02_01815 [Candidatus Andersenbacteria bacterium RIFCSPHIGHO2_02_FULL_45_11]OGY33369.1 MAG: hypothetical protein A3D99_02820 [Candidatus Andersenbacteria bacterium RIFCSPHIGHO2_12_FULL_45_11]